MPSVARNKCILHSTVFFTMSTQTESQNADKIKEEVRQVIRRLTELSQTQEDFDQFCAEVLGRLVDITGAHGALHTGAHEALHTGAHETLDAVPLCINDPVQSQQVPT